MAVPNPRTRQPRATSHRKRGRLLPCLLLSGFVLVASLYTLAHMASLPVSSNPPLPTLTVDLPNEDWFRQTLKSCVPSHDRKCMEFIPEGSNTQRIAILSPPGKAARFFSRLIRLIIETSNPKGTEVLESSSVPPYGYGKTHGLTKIIRLEAQNLVLGAADALVDLSSTDAPQNSLSIADLKTSLRQIVRWHCRLSHVAAHTSELNIRYQDVTKAFQEVVNNISSFASKSGEKGQLLQVPSISSESPSYWDARNLIASIQVTSGVDVVESLASVLSDEMTLSKNLTAWPCQSFWAAGGEERLSVITSKLAQTLSPNCSAEFASCFVQRDKCEAAGDALCKGTK